MVFQLVWMRQPDTHLRLPNMLVLDSFRDHTSPGVKGALKKTDTDLVVTPGGMTPQLQPLDVAGNKPFKDRAVKYYREWLAKDAAVMTPTGRREKAPLSEVATWVAAAWDDLLEEIILTGFKKRCISNALDGTEDDAIWYADDASEASENSFPSSFNDKTYG